MKLHVFDNGALYLDEQILIPGKNNATYKNQKRPAEWVLSPMMSFLIQWDGGNLLYDTGYHESFLLKNQPNQDMDRGAVFIAEPEQLLPQRLTQLGLKPEDITHVVQSHLHGDHVGYLYLCKNAEAIIHENEFTQMVKNWAMKTPVAIYSYADFDRFLGANLKYNLIGDDTLEYEIAPGLKVLNFGSGHTFGNLGVFVSLPKSGNYFLVSDALYTEQTINKLPGVVYDSLGYFKATKFIVKYAKEHNATIIYGHNRFQMQELKKAPEGFYD